MEPTRVANQLAEVPFRIKEMRQICGFTQAEMERYQKVIESTAHLILEFSQEGGFDHAANL